LRKGLCERGAVRQPLAWEERRGAGLVNREPRAADSCPNGRAGAVGLALEADPPTWAAAGFWGGPGGPAPKGSHSACGGWRPVLAGEGPALECRGGSALVTEPGPISCPALSRVRQVCPANRLRRSFPAELDSVRAPAPRREGSGCSSALEANGLLAGRGITTPPSCGAR